MDEDIIKAGGCWVDKNCRGCYLWPIIPYESFWKSVTLNESSLAANGAT